MRNERNELTNRQRHGNPHIFQIFSADYHGVIRSEISKNNKKNIKTYTTPKRTVEQ